MCTCDIQVSALGLLSTHHCRRCSSEVQSAARRIAAHGSAVANDTRRRSMPIRTEHSLVMPRGTVRIALLRALSRVRPLVLYKRTHRRLLRGGPPLRAFLAVRLFHHACARHASFAHSFLSRQMDTLENHVRWLLTQPKSIALRCHVGSTLLGTHDFLPLPPVPKAWFRKRPFDTLTVQCGAPSAAFGISAAHSLDSWPCTPALQDSYAAPGSSG